ncbi:MAG TPA: thiamine pyrophosphate-dependent dehydrogenase E1 component subunit alpha [Clostridiaceae bacterium]|nr:thiamine pyrophosphate-dependent dehydrogenase E1 component subunit alpha [Clostridiaceae bacterium]
MVNNNKTIKVSAPITVGVPEEFWHNTELLSKMLRYMYLVRYFEEKIFWLFAQGLVHGTMHLGIGEEATSIGTTFALNDDDYAYATHRGHGQAIGKGCDLDLMMAEILGREEGLCNGRGGSMHIADFSKGLLGANGIVGANGPLACGAAFSCKAKGLDRVCACFIGDGANNEGAVLESLNLAAAWDLPVMFVTINNTYGMSTSIEKVTRNSDLTKRAIPFDMPCYEVDGNDIAAVYSTVKEARARAVKQGPVMIVEHTYRISGHSKSDGNLYRSKEEIDHWKEKCPIKNFRRELLQRNIFSEEELDRIKNQAEKRIDKAIEFAKNCAQPKTEEVLKNVFAE